jgi:hypothetical protein
LRRQRLCGKHIASRGLARHRQPLAPTASRTSCGWAPDSPSAYSKFVSYRGASDRRLGGHTWMGCPDKPAKPE